MGSETRAIGTRADAAVRSFAGAVTLGLMHGFMAFTMAGATPATVSAQAPAAAAPLVFDEVTVVDVEHGRLLPAQRVVIVGSRIQAMGAAGAVETPRGAQVVDARGKYLIPGLWDMHVHQPSNIDFYYSLFIANGVTGIRDAHSGVPLKTQVQWRQEILAGARVGPPRQLLAGGSFGQHYSNSDSAAVERIVDSLEADGANFLKVYPYSATVAAAARRAGLPFGGHMISISFGSLEAMGMRLLEAPETAIEASDAGMRLFDHTTVAKLTGLCFGENASVERCQPVAERFRRNGSWWNPTLFMEKTNLYAQRARTFLGGAAMRGNWLRDSVARPKEAGRLRVAQRAGLPMLTGTDVGSALQHSPPGFSLHAELAALVEEGFSPLEALQAATLNPAKLLSGTDSLGTVAPGKLADLILLDADPLTDITNTTTIRAVVANGRYFDRTALDKLVAEARATNRYESLAAQYEKARQQTPEIP